MQTPQRLGCLEYATVRTLLRVNADVTAMTNAKAKAKAKAVVAQIDAQAASQRTTNIIAA